MSTQSSSPPTPYTPPPELLAAAEKMLFEASPGELAIADKLYVAYGSVTGQRSAVTGAELPAFDICRPLVRAGWLATVRAARECYSVTPQSKALRIGECSIAVDATEAEAAMSRLEARAEALVANLEKADALLSRVDQVQGRTPVTCIHGHIDYSAVVERLARHGYATGPRGPQGGLRVDVRQGEDPGRWAEVADSVLVTLNNGGPDAVAMALHLMMGGPRGGEAERLIEEAGRRETEQRNGPGGFLLRIRDLLSRLWSGGQEVTEEAEEDLYDEPADEEPGPVASMTLTAWTPETGEALVNFAQGRVAELRHGPGVPPGDTINISSEGQIDRFLMGISEIASATRDLAEASKAVDLSGTDVIDLIYDVTKVLHSRVKALAPPSTGPTANA
jgi:hypothetical protein